MHGASGRQRVPSRMYERGVVGCRQFVGLVGIGKYLTSRCVFQGDCLHSCVLAYVWLSGRNDRERVKDKQNV
jgi:hypothetical protein